MIEKHFFNYIDVIATFCSKSPLLADFAKMWTCVLHYRSLCIRKHESYKPVITKLLINDHCAGSCPLYVNIINYRI